MSSEGLGTAFKWQPMSVPYAPKIGKTNVVPMSVPCDEIFTLAGARERNERVGQVNISVTACEAPATGTLDDLYVEVRSTVVSDWPSVREALEREYPGMFAGYQEKPSDWFADPNPQTGTFVETWLVCAKETV